MKLRKENRYECIKQPDGELLGALVKNATIYKAFDCEYCGSKVYDFLALNFSSKEQKSDAQTFIRIRLDDGEYVLPILSFDNASITMTPQYDEFDFFDGRHVLSKIVSIERRVDLSCFCGELMKVGGVKE